MMLQAATQDEESSAPAELGLDQAIRFAMKLHRNQQLEGAETLYRRILDCVPDHPDMLHHLGLTRYQRGHPQEAIELINAAVEQVPGFADYRANLANVYLSQGRLEEAMASCRRAIELDPRRADFHNNLGVLWRALGRPEEAESAYLRAVELDPAHFRAYNNLGMLAAARGDAELAVRHYCTSITLTPGHPEGHKLLGLAYYQLGRLDEAAAVFRHWLEQDPGNPTATHHLAACSGQGVPERAADDYVASTFDAFAASFEDQLQNRLSYRAPQQVVEALQRHLKAPAAQFDILDLGCGTGLCGPLVRPWAASLCGIDLSVGMLRKAEAKDCYDSLWRIELGEFLRQPEQAAAWDLILSADTLCYFGSLEPVAVAAFNALRPGGLFAFSVEDGGEQGAVGGHRLNPNGRYSHARGYLTGCLAAAGFELLELESVVLRSEGGKPVPGIVAVGRR
jgi:predicted TPR repeat methyltransferase